MRKNFIALSTLLFALPAISLTSCDQSTDKRLEIVTMPTRVEYYRYELFDSSGLIVNASEYRGDSLVKSEETTDYNITFRDSGEIIDENTVFKETGSEIVLSINKEGYDSAYFAVKVENVSGVRQEIEIVSLPETHYQPGDTFSSEGLSLNLVTTFRTINDGQKRVSSALTDYDLTIDSETADGYQLPLENGRVPVTITTTAYDGDELSTTFGVFVLRQTVEGPTIYEDDTIHLVEDDNSLTVSIDGFQESSADDKGYYSPDEVELGSTFYDYSQHSYDNWKYAPSYSKTGTQQTPLLVVPVIVPGYESMATDANWDIIKKVFFGDSGDMKFESLHSYYYKSSNGKLDITGTITDYYFAGDESSLFEKSDIQDYQVAMLAQDCAEWAKDIYNLNLQDYDSDKDGLIDAMWLVYIGPRSNDYSAYWAFSSTTMAEGDIENPEVNNYGWCGFDFLTTSSDDFANEDAHVVIHETGHMLGLNDYYSYAYSHYGPLGRIDMMDNNVGDHNGYSKMMLGWTKPYIAYGDCEITIPSSLHENAIIVIPYDGKTYQKNSAGKYIFNPFDEYLLLEFYVPDDLNELDYDFYNVQTIKDYGLRVYHVDNRLAHVENGRWSFYQNPDDGIADTSGNRNAIISNTETNKDSAYGYGESYYVGIPESANRFDEIRWITQDNTYLSQNYSIERNPNILFKTEDEFTLDTYKSQFNDDGFNCGEAFTSSFRVTEIRYQA